MDRPICLITGATDGIGKVTAAALAPPALTRSMMARMLSRPASVTATAE